MSLVSQPGHVFSLEQLGFSPFFQRQLGALSPPLEPARVAAGGRGLLDLLTARGPRRAPLSGRLLHESEAQGGAALPAVGDWVGLRSGPDHDGPIVHRFERRTCLLRQAPGRRSEPQILAANVDTVMVVTSLNADFNPRRLERYLELAMEGGARPLFVLNKADLCADPAPFLDAVRDLAPSAQVIAVSALGGGGLDALRAHVGPGETVALLGSSGVGKSTIVNCLLGVAAQPEGEIRAHDDRGRHTTTHRELFVLASGGLLIDTPGLRELKPWSPDAAGPAGFADVEAIATECRFRDCSHDGEPGCAVSEALAEGRLDAGRFAGFLKRCREARHLREQVDALAQLKTKRRWKQISKALRHNPKG